WRALPAASRSLFLLHWLAAEEEVRPELVPLVAFVERNRGIDDLVGKLVERRVDLQVRRHAVHRLEKFLALARQQECGEQERRVGTPGVFCQAERARLAERRLQRLPVDGSALLLQRLHIVVIGADEQRYLARGHQLRPEDMAVADTGLHRGKTLE